MVERCQRDLPAYEFIVGDASELGFAADNSYDFVLFSYNGIDHLELPDRQRAFAEMKRVLRPGGIMAFSSHNANFLPIDHRSLPLPATWRPAGNGTVAEMGDDVQLPQSDIALPPSVHVGMVNDGLHSFRSSGICYIRPDLQVEALSQLGLEEIACARNDSANYVDAGDPLVATFDSPWVYYRCHKAGRLD